MAIDKAELQAQVYGLEQGGDRMTLRLVKGLLNGFSRGILYCAFVAAVAFILSLH